MSRGNRFDPAQTMRINLPKEHLEPAVDAEPTPRGRGRMADGIGATSFAAHARDDMVQIESTEYERLLQSIYDAVLITDSRGNISDYNRRSLEFFCFSPEELDGRSVTELIAGIDDDIMSAIRSNLVQRRFTLIEGNCVRRDLSTFPSEVAINRLDLDPEGRLCFFVRDISVRKRAQNALEEAVARLEAHDRARSQFVSNVSHELRTPLTSMIYAITNMLRGVVGPVSDRVEHYLEMLQGDCKRLLATVSDILDLRKLETSELVLHRSHVPMGRMVRRTAESLAVQADQKGVEFELSIAEECGFVNCDVEKFERVVINIVGNAIKFTPAGGTVRVALALHPVRVNRLLLSVQDDGIGIPPEALPRVTERYFTVGDQPSGSGLGLAISREIVELHGGRMALQSPPPGGQQGTLVEIGMGVVTPPLVLIVDNDKALLAALSEQISGQGYRVATSESGAQAMASIEASKPDMVVLDLMLPDTHGTELVLKIKAGADTGDIPILALTGTELERSKATVLTNFGVPFLMKPWGESELLDRIERLSMNLLPFSARRS